MNATISQVRPLAIALSLALAGCKVHTSKEALAGNYPVEPGGKLVMNLWQGAVDVRTADVSTAKIEVRREKKTLGTNATEELRRQPISITNQGNILRVTCQRQATDRAMIDLNDVSDTYVVTIPKKFSVEIETGSGGLRIAPLEGNVQLVTSGSGILLEDVTGSGIIRSAGGDIKVGGITGRLEIKTAGGNLSIGRALGGLEAKSAGGDIKIGESKGSAIIKTSGGNIQVEAANGPVQAATSGGDVKVQYATAPVGDISLTSSGGDIRISLPGNTAASIDAGTSSGSATTDFPISIEGKAKENRLNGTIGALPSQAQIKLRTSGGDVRIVQNPSANPTK